MDVLGSREKLTVAEGKEFLKKIIFSDNSIYRYLTAEDQTRLKAVLPIEYEINPESKNLVMTGLFSHIEGVRKDIDFKLVANLIKIMAIAMFHQSDLHADALVNTLERIYDLLFSCIFEEGA